MSTSSIVSASARSSTGEPIAGRNEQRRRSALRPRRKSIDAGWIELSAIA